MHCKTKGIVIWSALKNAFCSSLSVFLCRLYIIYDFQQSLLIAEWTGMGGVAVISSCMYNQFLNTGTGIKEFNMEKSTGTPLTHPPTGYPGQ